jgi:small subunit ribosomal protein S34
MTTLFTATLRQRMSSLPSAKASTSSLLGSSSLHNARLFSSESLSSQQSLPSLLTSHIDKSTLVGPLAPSRKSKTLYEHLVSLPNDGVGTRVRQVKWAARGIDIPWGKEFTGPIADASRRKQEDHLCYWEVTRVRIKWTGENMTPHGKAWGRLVWRGERKK